MASGHLCPDAVEESGCPTCYLDQTAERIKSGKRRAQRARDEQAAIQVAGFALGVPGHEKT